MPRVSRGNPRSRQVHTGSDGPSIGRAGAANPVIDGNRIWFGRPVGLYSISNPDDELHYIRVEVGNLKNDDYDLSLELDVFSSSERMTYPVDRQPDFDKPPDSLLRINKYTDVQRQSGCLFSIPPQSRVHVAIRLTADRKDLLEFPIALYEHAGPDLDSPLLGDRPLVKSLEWMPAPTADLVETKVFSTPGRFLFWELEPEPDWVRFRRWNVDPRSGRFPWSLGLFHHPECIVRITNNSSIPVAVSPRLVLGKEDSQGNAVSLAQEEVLDTRAPLAPGEEREWPCPISLDDRRLAKQQAEQLRVSAYTDVLGPSNTPIGKVDAPERIRGEYISYPSKIIDWVVLVGGLVFTLLLLWWVFVGFSVRETPKVALKLEFSHSDPDALPAGISDRNPLEVTLMSKDSRLTSTGNRRPGTTNIYDFTFRNTGLGRYRLFFGYSLPSEFKVKLSDLSGTMQFKTEDTLPLTLFAAADTSHAPRVIANIDAGESPSSSADKDLDNAMSMLHTAIHAMKSGGQPNPELIQQASPLIYLAATKLDSANLPAKSPEKAKLQGARDLLLVATVAAGEAEGANKKDVAVEQQADKLLSTADSDLSNSGMALSLKGDVVGANHEVSSAEAAVTNSARLMQDVTNPGLKRIFEAHMQSTGARLEQLRTTITKKFSANVPPKNTAPKQAARLPENTAPPAESPAPPPVEPKKIAVADSHNAGQVQAPSPHLPEMPPDVALILNPPASLASDSEIGLVSMERLFRAHTPGASWKDTIDSQDFRDGAAAIKRALANNAKDPIALVADAIRCDMEDYTIPDSTHDDRELSLDNAYEADKQSLVVNYWRDGIRSSGATEDMASAKDSIWETLKTQKSVDGKLRNLIVTKFKQDFNSDRLK